MTLHRPLKVVFAGGNGYPPEAAGGVQSSTHHLATALAAQGHQPSVLTSLYGDGWFGMRARVQLKLSGKGYVTDGTMGYPVHRAWFAKDQIGALLRTSRPDVAVVQCHGSVAMGKAFSDAGVPLVVYLRNVEFDELGGDPRDLPDARFIANSDFTARRYAEVFGITATVIRPSINRTLYQTTPDGDGVTFIGPVAAKGLDRAIEMAIACPDIPFLFVESWLLSAEQLAALEARIAGISNIRFERRTADMKSLFRRTRILLAPSRWEEAWGRVASEAHCSGIPVVGSSRGGLAEAIGPGGVALDYDAPLADWVASLRKLWSDPVEYSRVSQAARSYSLRPELDSEQQFITFLSVLESALHLQQTA